MQTVYYLDCIREIEYVCKLSKRDSGFPTCLSYTHWLIDRNNWLTLVEFTYYSTHRFVDPDTKSEKWNRRPGLTYYDVRLPPPKTPVDPPSRTRWSQGKWRWSVEELETITAGTKPRTSHCRPPEEERGIEGGSARQSSSKGRGRATVNHTGIGTASETTPGKLLKRCFERIWAFPSA